ncbi:hypothetical protein WA158_002783 [Blastocystis sp. Blastoise]
MNISLACDYGTKYLTDDLETALRKIALNNGISVTSCKTSTRMIKKVLQYIPYVLSQRERNSAKDMFIHSEECNRLNIHNSLYLLILKIIKKYFLSYLSTIYVDDYTIIKEVRSSLADKLNKCTFHSFFGFQLISNGKKIQKNILMGIQF